MSGIITVNYNHKPCYDIMIENDFDKLKEKMMGLELKDAKAMIITDSNVGPIYLDVIKDQIKDVCSNTFCYQITAGETSKNLDTVQAIIREMIDHSMNRHDFMIALGGGVVGDITGFVASIYMRGIPFIQLPTSLLAQVDSSIGGKTGVDFEEYKNMIGAFHMPLLVYINTATLDTLDARQFYSGMAEVMKYGLIMDASFYEWLLDKLYEIHERKPDIMEEMIEYSCKCKQRIVEKDPLENGDRALLNYGHTIGHAIEKAMDFTLLHGECVALGCVAAAYISWKKDRISMDEYYEIRDMFVPFNLPISITGIKAQNIVALTKSDKKAISNGIRFILLKKVGKAVIDSTVTEDEILAAVNELIYEEEC